MCTNNCNEKDMQIKLINKLNKTEKYLENKFVKDFNESVIPYPNSKDFIDKSVYMYGCASKYFKNLEKLTEEDHRAAMSLFYGHNLGLDESVNTFKDIFDKWYNNISIDITGFEANKYFDLIFGTHDCYEVYERFKRLGVDEIEYCKKDDYIDWLSNSKEYTNDEDEIKKIDDEITKIEEKYPFDYCDWDFEYSGLSLNIVQNKIFDEFYKKCEYEDRTNLVLEIIKRCFQTTEPYDTAIAIEVVNKKKLKKYITEDIVVDNVILILSEHYEGIMYDSYSPRNTDILLHGLRNFTLLKQLNIIMKNIINS